MSQARPPSPPARAGVRAGGGASVSMRRRRRVAYSLSAVAVACFFLLPLPVPAVLLALALQTIAFLYIAGKSPIDGLLLTGVSVLLVGLLPAGHPLVAGFEGYPGLRWWLLLTGTGLVLCMAAVLVLASRDRARRG